LEKFIDGELAQCISLVNEFIQGKPLFYTGITLFLSGRECSEQYFPAATEGITGQIL
jgi:hypothetical protein